MSTYKDKLNEMIEDLQQEKQYHKKLLKECVPYINYYINNVKRLGFTPDAALLKDKIYNVIGENS